MTSRFHPSASAGQGNNVTLQCGRGTSRHGLQARLAWPGRREARLTAVICGHEQLSRELGRLGCMGRFGCLALSYLLSLF